MGGGGGGVWELGRRMAAAVAETEVAAGEEDGDNGDRGARVRVAGGGGV